MREHRSERALMPGKHESLEGARPQHEALAQIERVRFEPAEHRRPPAALSRWIGVPRQHAPMRAGACVVLDVISVVEEQDIVWGPVVADRSTRVLIVPLQKTKQHSA